VIAPGCPACIGRRNGGGLDRPHERVEAGVLAQVEGGARW
jgi:hypothetical protein